MAKHRRPSSDPELRAIAEGLERVKDAEERLEARRRDYVLKARSKGFSWLEISKRVGLSVGAVHARYAGLNGTSHTTHFSPATDVDVIPKLSGAEPTSKATSKPRSESGSKPGSKSGSESTTKKSTKKSTKKAER